MPEDSCDKEQKELLEAQKELDNHIANPMGWDPSGEDYQTGLSNLKQQVANLEKALRDCEEKNAQ